jgi:hypothetical protein
MFRNNFNNLSSQINSSMTITTLNYIKEILTQQRENYINLLNENRRMTEIIDTFIYQREIPTTSRNPQQSMRTNLFPMNDNVLSNEEILRYTTAHRYSEIQEPLNARCYLSGTTFRHDDWVCKLPCGHLFDGPSICYHLTHVNSSCPMCNQNILQTTNTTNTTFPQRQNTDTPRLRRTRNRNNVANSFNDYFSNEFVDLFTAILSTTIPVTQSNLLTEREIENAIEQIRYGDIESPISERCPISYIEFENDTNVSRIKHCQHIFDLNSLSEWLTRHNTCPVCRYDLKTYNINDNQSRNDDVPRNNEETKTNDASSRLNNFRNLYDASGNLIYNRNGRYSTYYYFTT